MNKIKIWRCDIDINNYSNEYTSQEWFDLTNPDLVLSDPDGWDRTNYEYSFYEEKITKKEFEQRIYSSTIYFK